MPVCVILIGKGKETRTGPIMNKTIQLLEIYMKEITLTGKDKLDYPIYLLLLPWK